MFGYSSEELIGKPVSILNAPSDKSPEEIKQDIVDTVIRTNEWHGEILNIKKNGDHFWCYVNISIFDHPDYGKVYLSVHTNITKRKMAEAALSENVAKFRGIFENSLLGISIASPEGILLLVNSAYSRMYGYESPDKMLQEVTNVEKLYAQQEERKEILRMLQKDGKMEPREVEVIRRDGTKFLVLVTVSVVRDFDGHLLYNQAIHLDLSERIKSEEKVRDAALYTRSLIESNLDPLIAINTDGKITDVNVATEQITGLERVKLIGSDFVDYFAEPEKVRREFGIILSRGLVKNFPLTIRHTSGRTTDVLFNATLFKNLAGEVQGVFADARDITDRKKIDEELRKSKELLEKLNQHLHDVRENERAFISREIHDELGQSMTALKLDLKMMHKYVGTNPEAIMKLDSIIELVSDTIKDVQRISSDLRPGILDDLGLISSIEWYCEEFEKRTGIKCNLKLDNSDYSDSQIKLTFFRILQETLTNVIRHANASSVNVKLHKSLKGATLTIQDNGIGIPEEKIESHKSLGLISIRERVRQLNGKLDISSKKATVQS
jgi:PAS domain S-box-containing protein